MQPNLVTLHWRYLVTWNVHKLNSWVLFVRQWFKSSFIHSSRLLKLHIQTGIFTRKTKDTFLKDGLKVSCFYLGFFSIRFDFKITIFWVTMSRDEKAVTW